MYNFFYKEEINLAKNLQVMQSQIHNLGVFAGRSFAAGEIIEIAPVILLGMQDRDFLQHTALFNYYFLVSDKKYQSALGLGYSSLYNHSYNANADYTIQIKKECLVIKALKFIKAGDEILINYNGSPDDETPVYFKPE